ncbi:MAG: tetratricopeptide repeat protein, partial [Lachnospiraceae bacterium]|nr:tetratricopeptide repeat protein [Lachnospiraceae bacterium]
MDKQDYRTKLDEAKKRIEEGDKEEAFYILDGMNWRRVHNVNALLSAADIYEKEGRYERAKELLELAHERSPIGRIIIYRLALLSIRLEEYAEAKEYYEEFIEIAPHDSLQYIIQFELAKAQGVEDITLISILVEVKEHDFLEEWAYELALLYHKTGQINKCISSCDEIILWYGDGPSVVSALELKLLYQPLDEGQKDKYKDFLKRRDGIIEVKPGEEFGGNGEILTAPIEIPEVALSNDRFNTQNLQAEIKRNIEEIMQATKTGDISRNLRNIEGLVEDIPFAKEPRDDTGPMEEASIKKEEGRKIDDTLRNHFREYLEEERDGQMSLSLPDTREAEPQVAGQMTIDQIIEDWQKTARAAEAALSEADEQRLENAKARALDEANHIYERLEQAGRKMEAGVAPKDLLRSEYMSDLPTHRQELGNRFSTVKKQLGAAGGEEAEAQKKAAIRSQDTTFLPTGSRARQRRGGQKPREDAYLPAGAKATADTIRVLEEEGPQETLRRFATKRIDKPEKSEREKEREALKNQSTFKIRKVDAQTGEGNGVGFEVPIMESEDLPKKSEDSAARAEQLSRDAVRIVSDVNEMLQKEIDRATGRMPRRAEIEAEMNRREGSESASEATVADVLNILEKAVDGNTGRIDLASIPKEKTQAFAEAV